MHEARDLLRTCRQIRDEGNQVFYKVNSWTLHRARLRETPRAYGTNASTMVHDTQMIYDRLGQSKAMKHFRHVNMRISLAPLAYCDFHIPDSIALDDPFAMHLFELQQHPELIATHKIKETAQCELFRAAIDGFVRNRACIFPILTSITLEVNLHTKKAFPHTPKNPLDRCGITLYIRIKLEDKGRATLTDNIDASLPTLVPSSVIHDLSSLQLNKDEAHEQNLDSSILNRPWSSPPLEHRRRMLSPLGRLLGVQSVEVERRWTVHFRKRSSERGLSTIHVQPLRQLWRFRTVVAMLERAGHGFIGFLDPALEYLETSPNDVINIIENATEDAEYLLIP